VRACESKVTGLGVRIAGERRAFTCVCESLWCVGEAFAWVASFRTRPVRGESRYTYTWACVQAATGVLGPCIMGAWLLGVFCVRPDVQAVCNQPPYARVYYLRQSGRGKESII
jgi:hypothetical protein